MELSPGEAIREELKGRGWGQEDLARIMGRAVGRVNEIITGKQAISAEIAIELSVAFGTTPEIWMQREATYRLSLVKDDASDVRERARLFSIAPIKEMQKRGWIKATNSVAAIDKELRQFFDVPSLDVEPDIAASARKTAKDEPINPAQRAWCFRARNLARMVAVNQYDENRFPDLIEKLRKLAAYPDEIRRVPKVLADYGIKFLVVEPIAKTRIDGVAFWLNDSPVIAVSARYDRINSFWQTLGHELSHIKHRDAVSVDVDMVGTDRLSPAEQSAIERRADAEAAASWIDPKDLDSFIVRIGPLYSKDRINQFANRIRIHPGIIVGQLQFRGEISYGFNREMLVAVREVLLTGALTDGWGHSVESK